MTSYAWRTALLGVALSTACSSEPSSPPRTDTSVTSAVPPAMTAPPAPPPRPAVQLPPEPPPPVADLAAEVPSWETKLAANKAYTAALAPGGEADFTLLASGVSAMIVEAGLYGEALGPMQAKKPLMDAAIAVYMVFLRVGHFPEDFTTHMRQVLEAGKGAPHLGVWAPFEKGKVPHDFAALALWMNRDQPAYVRELLAARSDAHHVSPWMSHDKPPSRPYLAEEQGALEWLARLDPLTAEEQRRLGELKLEAAIVRVQIETLLGDYKANEVRADATYKGKPVEVTGIVGDVKKDVLGSIYVTLGTGQPFDLQHVQCFVSKKHESDVLALSKGDRATVRGIVDGQVLVNVIVKVCEVRK